MLLTIFAGAGYIKAFEDTRTAGGALGDPALAQRIYGFASTDQIALLLLAFAATTLLLLLVLLALMLYREGSLETIRVRATNLPPEVTLRRGQTHHIFLSHLWATCAIPVTRTRHARALLPLAKAIRRFGRRLTCVVTPLRTARTGARTPPRRSSYSCSA